MVLNLERYLYQTGAQRKNKIKNYVDTCRGNDCDINETCIRTTCDRIRVQSHVISYIKFLLR